MVNLVLKPNMPCTSSFALDPRRAGRRTSAHRPRPRMMTRTCMGNRFHVLFRSLQHYTALSGVFVFGWAGWNSLSGYSIFLVSRFYKAASCITRIPEIVWIAFARVRGCILWVKKSYCVSFQMSLVRFQDLDTEYLLPEEGWGHMTRKRELFAGERWEGVLWKIGSWWISYAESCQFDFRDSTSSSSWRSQGLRFELLTVISSVLVRCGIRFFIAFTFCDSLTKPTNSQ